MREGSRGKEVLTDSEPGDRLEREHPRHRGSKCKGRKVGGSLACVGSSRRPAWSPWLLWGKGRGREIHQKVIDSHQAKDEVAWTRR